MTTPLVSVVTPCYNTGAFLRATIDSIVMQAYPRVQHLVMDGGSTDDTVAILQEYPQVEWVSEKDRGQSDALNKGFRRAQGEIIGWLNADDTYAPDAIATAVAYLEAHPEADAVFTDVFIIDETGAVIGRTHGAPFDPVQLLTSNMVKQPSLFMRRRVIDALGGVDERYHFVMDQELWLRMGMAGFHIVYLPGRPLANFRICGGTKTFESAPRFHQEWEQVITEALAQPFFSTLPSRIGTVALNTNAAGMHVASMVSAAEAGRRRALLRHLVRAVMRHRGLVRNAGLWRIALSGLFGVSRDRLRKFSRALPSSDEPHV